MPTARFHLGVGVIVDRFIWTFGGLSEGKNVEVIEVFDTKNKQMDNT